MASAKFEVSPGGKGLNQSIAAARAGSEIYHAGKIGPDGQTLLETLTQNGVHTDFVSLNGSCSGHTVAQVNKYGNSCVLQYAGANREITKGEIDGALKAFNAGDILMLQNGVNNLSYIVGQAHRKYIKIVLNPSPADSALREIDFSKIAYLVLNEAEGEDITGEQNPNRIMDNLLSQYPHLKVVLTLGKIGALYGDGMHRIQQAAYQVEAVDASAAGDTFLGYFISRVSMGAPSWSAMRIAAMAAAYSVTKMGAVASIPTWDEVLRFSASRDKAGSLPA